MAELRSHDPALAVPPAGRFRRAGVHDELVRSRVADSVVAIGSLCETPMLGRIGSFADLIVSSLSNGGKVLFFGNGGSAADATHLAAEFVGRYRLEREPLPALSLTDNASSMSAIGNDYSYDEVFARQLRGLGQAGDVAVGLSTSGGSRNVLRGLREAGAHGMRTVAMTGAADEQLSAVSELCLAVQSTSTAQIQECHQVIGHTVCEIVESALFGR